MDSKVTLDDVKKWLQEGVGRGFKHVRVYSKRERDMVAGCAIAVEHGWLKPGEIIEIDEQSSVLRYEITEKALDDFGPEQGYHCPHCGRDCAAECCYENQCPSKCGASDG